MSESMSGMFRKIAQYESKYACGALIQMVLMDPYVGHTSLGELGGESGSTDATRPSIYA
jgi:hypothetical protein